MMKIIFIRTTLTILITLAIYSPETFGQVNRPPQYVLLAFDGSLNLDMWNETLTFAKKNNLKFTYFLSGVYFLLDANKKNYIEPTHGAGKSNIGFAGDSKQNLINRVSFVNQAYDNGHSIGSHANGHFDETAWTLSQWESELKQFYHLIFDVYQINDISAPTNLYHFKPEEITGFRAPLLTYNDNLYKVLGKNKFSYDTSKTSSMDYWPEIKNGIWNFPLAELRIAGSGKRTLSMDYNFYYTQSGGVSDPNLDHDDLYKKEMLDTYMGYFETNYYGNRAPVHIGHHFSKWNNGAYWKAFQEFSSIVCMKPEVRCVGYGKLVNYMNSLTPQTIKAYRKGEFKKMPMPPSKIPHIASVSPLDITMTMKEISPDTMEVKIEGSQLSLLPPMKQSSFVWKIDNKEIYRTQSPLVNISTLISNTAQANKLTVAYEYKGREFLKTSHQMLFNFEGNPQFLEEDLEKRSVLGDLPEAHRD